MAPLAALQAPAVHFQHPPQPLVRGRGALAQFLGQRLVVLEQFLEHRARLPRRLLGPGQAELRLLDQPHDHLRQLLAVLVGQLQAGLRQPLLDQVRFRLGPGRQHARVATGLGLADQLVQLAQGVAEVRQVFLNAGRRHLLGRGALELLLHSLGDRVDQHGEGVLRRLLEADVAGVLEAEDQGSRPSSFPATVAAPTPAPCADGAGVLVHPVLDDAAAQSPRRLLQQPAARPQDAVRAERLVERAPAASARVRQALEVTPEPRRMSSAVRPSSLNSSHHR